MQYVVFYCFLLGALYVIWRVTDSFAGSFLRPMVRLARTTLRRVRDVVWTNPMRQYGFFKTIWLWLLILAATSSLCCLGILPTSPGMALVFGLFVLVVWAVVGLGWWAMRWRARRRYTPRPLHTRRRRR